MNGLNRPGRSRENIPITAESSLTVIAKYQHTQPHCPLQGRCCEGTVQDQGDDNTALAAGSAAA
jgi:hypothetical protein